MLHSIKCSIRTIINIYQRSFSATLTEGQIIQRPVEVQLHFSAVSQKKVKSKSPLWTFLEVLLYWSPPNMVWTFSHVHHLAPCFCLYQAEHPPPTLYFNFNTYVNSYTLKSGTCTNFLQIFFLGASAHFTCFNLWERFLRFGCCSKCKCTLFLMTYLWSRPRYHSHRQISLSCGSAAMHSSEGPSSPPGVTLQVALILWVIKTAHCDTTVPNTTCTRFIVPKVQPHYSPASSLQSDKAEEDCMSGLRGVVWLLQHEIRLQTEFYWLMKSHTGTEVHQPEGYDLRWNSSSCWHKYMHWLIWQLIILDFTKNKLRAPGRQAADLQQKSMSPAASWRKTLITNETIFNCPLRINKTEVISVESILSPIPTPPWPLHLLTQVVIKYRF